jgi:hypothetical protein
MAQEARLLDLLILHRYLSRPQISGIQMHPWKLDIARRFTSKPHITCFVDSVLQHNLYAPRFSRNGSECIWDHAIAAGRLPNLVSRGRRRFQDLASPVRNGRSCTRLSANPPEPKLGQFAGRCKPDPSSVRSSGTLETPEQLELSTGPALELGRPSNAVRS